MRDLKKFENWLLASSRALYRLGVLENFYRRGILAYSHSPQSVRAPAPPLAFPMRRIRPEGETSARMNGFSAREKEVLEQLVQGFAAKEIASHLEISFDTVRTYIKRVYNKLNVHSRGEAVARYLGQFHE